MSAALLATIASLTGIIREESMLLGLGEAHDIAELAAAKQRLAASLEQQLATLDRERPTWQAALPSTDALALGHAVAELQAAAIENGEFLARQIDLSRGLMGAIAAEARRLAGTTHETYGASGTVTRTDASASFAVNASL